MSMIKYSFVFLLHSILLQTTDCIQSSKLTKWARWNEKNVTFGTPIGSEKSVSLKTCFVKCQEISVCLSIHFNETNSTCEFSAYYPPARTVSPTPRTGWTVHHMLLACNKYNICQNGGTCNDGSYSNTCSCVAGYTGTNCETNINECASNPCQNGGTCTDRVNSYTCSCVAGYTGTNCQTNINECASNPCQNGGTCTDRVNSYTCSCVAGYTGTNCQTNINECATSPCQNGGTCIDGINSYSCTCTADYTGTTCQTQLREVQGLQAWQSSTFSDCYASTAIDGSTTVNVCYPPPCGCTCAHTDGDFTFWIMELNIAVFVRAVTIYFRVDSAESNYRNTEFKIMVYDSYNDAKADGNGMVCELYNASPITSAPIKLYCSQIIYGKAVRIQDYKTPRMYNGMHFCEVKVWYFPV